jgi:hypothetical protein
MRYNWAQQEHICFFGTYFNIRAKGCCASECRTFPVNDEIELTIS